VRRVAHCARRARGAAISCHYFSLPLADYAARYASAYF
jgi:hypothetical protein